MERKIPKTINYCWFGGGKKNKLFYKCLKSWKKYFPDYEIIEWNESNFDVHENQYCSEAYNEKKYAFVSDYARLKILYENGGIYFDTDVEVLKKFDLNILEEGYFAKERDNQINTGLGFCVPPKSKIIKSILDDYNKIKFIKDDGSLDLTACPTRNSETIEKLGYNISTDKQIDGIKIYDKEYFCGFDVDTQHYVVSDKSYTVHHYNASWLPKNKRISKNFKKAVSKIFGKRIYEGIKKIKKKIGE